MKPTPTPHRLRENPPAAERRRIARRIALMPFLRRDGSGGINWHVIASRLADELRGMAARLASDPQATPADQERVTRCRSAVHDYDVAADAGDEQF